MTPCLDYPLLLAEVGGAALEGAWGPFQLSNLLLGLWLGDRRERARASISLTSSSSSRNGSFPVLVLVWGEIKLALLVLLALVLVLVLLGQVAPLP